MESPKKRTPMDLYKERIHDHSCVRCGKTHTEGWTLRKCAECRKKESTYRKKTRDEHRKNQERDYQRKHWANRCCYLSKNSDARSNRTSDEPYVTPERLLTLRILQNNKCWYCDTELQVFNRKQPNGLTIERLDNKKSHTRSNCILCCHRCNCRKLSNKVTVSQYEIFYQLFNKFLQSKNCQTLLTQLKSLDI